MSPKQDPEKIRIVLEGLRGEETIKVMTGDGVGA
jgi:hypothetical protein